MFNIHQFRDKYNPFKIVKLFEDALSEYTRAPYVITVESGTAALFLCCKYLNVKTVTIPKRTYPSVPCSIKHAGGTVRFEDLYWTGTYQLKPYPIIDAAKRFTSNMYEPGQFMCLSFHSKKQLPIGRGGAILTDSLEAYNWFKLARFDGRHETSIENDTFQILGWNMYLTPEQAVRGIQLLTHIPEHNPDLPYEVYQDLSQYNMYTK